MGVCDDDQSQAAIRPNGNRYALVKVARRALFSGAEMRH
jgi:hypothetical protein